MQLYTHNKSPIKMFLIAKLSESFFYIFCFYHSLVFEPSFFVKSCHWRV